MSDIVQKFCKLLLRRPHGSDDTANPRRVEPGANPDKTFEWYQLIVQLGNFEAEFSGDRFHRSVTYNLAITGGILAVASFGYTHGFALAYLFCMFVAGLGAFTSYLWADESRSARYWTQRWRRVAGEIEESGAFRRATISGIHALSMDDEDIAEDETIERLDEEQRRIIRIALSCAPNQSSKWSEREWLQWWSTLGSKQRVNVVRSTLASTNTTVSLWGREPKGKYYNKWKNIASGFMCLYIAFAITFFFAVALSLRNDGLRNFFMVRSHKEVDRIELVAPTNQRPLKLNVHVSGESNAPTTVPSTSERPIELYPVEDVQSHQTN